MPLLEDIAARGRAILPEIEERIAVFPYLPKPEKVKSRFKTKPYAIVLRGDLEILDREPKDPKHPLQRALVRRNFDLTVILDPKLPGQEITSELIEGMENSLIDHFTNWVSDCWRFEPTGFAQVIDNDAEAGYALSLSAYAMLDASQIEPLGGRVNGHPLTTFKTQGTIT